MNFMPCTLAGIESIPLLRFLSFSAVQCMAYPTDVVIDYFAQPISDA